MLVLLSMALVLIATVLLVLGLLNDDGLNLIYLSILSSLAAFGVLLFALRANRSRTERRPALPEALADLEPEPEREPAMVGAAAGAAVTAVNPSPAPAVAASTSGGQGEWHASDLDDWSEPEAGADGVDDAADEVDDGWQEGDEVEFPIADYDSLTVGQILPLLPQLYSDEFDVVEERERATKARPQVLAKLAELRDGGVSADPLASYTEPVATEADEEEEWFPIEDYESLSAAQIQPLLPELDEEELELVRTRELELGRRRSLLDEIDRLLGDAPAAPAPATSKAAAAKAPAGSASRKAPAKRAASTASTKKAAAKKAATKRSTPTKQTTTAKKASAAKAPAKKASATRASAKKAPASKKAAPAKQAATKASSAKPAAAKKSTAKKATAKKTTAKKAAAPAKKAAKATKRSTKR